LINAIYGINCHLRIIGEIDFETKALLEKYGIAFSNDSDLNNEEIRNEYKNADIVAFCSIFEGFGLPIIEGQAMRTPVITSNISPLKEVAGGGAVLVNPSDETEIRNGLLNIIGSAELREKLIAAGLQNIKRFEPQSIARLYENLYDEITGSELSGNVI
jgi:glycosyltransferase involved in cell wall biosynthesis